ncbi:MAG: DUF938 domain-containing protein [bacterium]
MNKPFAESCEKNKHVILDVLRQQIPDQKLNLLEFSAGTGQHAVFLAPHFPKLTWYPTELDEQIPGLLMWLEEYPYPTIQPPIRYQLGLDRWPDVQADIVYTANTLHIMRWEHVCLFIQHMGENLRKKARFIVYGPFNFDGQFTSESNRKFDQWLKSIESHRGIRDFEAIQTEMNKAKIQHLQTIAMPANNFILIFEKS